LSFFVASSHLFLANLEAPLTSSAIVSENSALNIEKVLQKKSTATLLGIAALAVPGRFEFLTFISFLFVFGGLEEKAESEKKHSQNILMIGRYATGFHFRAAKFAEKSIRPILDNSADRRIHYYNVSIQSNSRAVFHFPKTLETRPCRSKTITLIV